MSERLRSSVKAVATGVLAVLGGIMVFAVFAAA